MVLVTGATGNVGHHVVQMLLDGGVKVRAVTRDPASAGLPAGADLVAGDPSHPQTLEAALRGVEAIFPTRGRAPAPARGRPSRRPRGWAGVSAKRSLAAVSA